MLDHLRATGPHSDLPEKLDIYGPLIGSWDIDYRQLDPSSGQWRENKLTWHFGRILGGLGVQDVLRNERGSGTTVRVFDLNLAAWRVTWYGPVSGYFATLVGRAHGDGIFQDGTDTDDRLIRWNFSDLEPDSFHWQGYHSSDSGETWVLDTEMRARRAG